MADSPAFVFVCEELERLTKLTRDEARGTVWLALRDAGFTASAVGPREMKVVLERLMPRELASRRRAGGGRTRRDARAAGSARAESQEAGTLHIGYTRSGSHDSSTIHFAM